MNKKVLIAESFKKFEHLIGSKMEVRFVNNINIDESIINNQYDAIILDESLKSQVNLIRNSEGNKNAFIVMFSTEGKYTPTADIVFTKEVTENKFLEIITLIENLFSKRHEAEVFNFMKRMILVKDCDMRTQIYQVPVLVKFIIDKLVVENIYLDYLNDSFINDTIYFSTFHDLGKLAIDNDKLHYTKEFNDKQRENMKLHTTLGLELYEAMTKIYPNIDSKVAKNIIAYHHERYNGTGYPKQLKGTDIPLEARIVAVADVYEALRSKRKYKDAYDHKTAFSIIMSEKNEHFDPNIVSVLEKYEQEFIELYESLT